MEALQNILSSTEYSFITAFVLGLMTAISPCPLATNITAIGFISRESEDRYRVFKSGLFYTLGRAFSYTAVALVLYFGASQMDVSRLFQGWGEKLIGPVLIIIGMFMLDIITFGFPAFNRMSEKLGARAKDSYWGSFLLGAVFAMAFCPYSGVLYFGMLMPITIGSASGLYLPAVFAVATGLPVVLFAWMLAFAVHNVGQLHRRIRNFELWMRRAVGILFICTGIYYIAQIFILN